MSESVEKNDLDTPAFVAMVLVGLTVSADFFLKESIIQEKTILIFGLFLTQNYYINALVLIAMISIFLLKRPIKNKLKTCGVMKATLYHYLLMLSFFSVMSYVFVVCFYLSKFLRIV